MHIPTRRQVAYLGHCDPHYYYYNTYLCHTATTMLTLAVTREIKAISTLCIAVPRITWMFRFYFECTCIVSMWSVDVIEQVRMKIFAFVNKTVHCYLNLLCANERNKIAESSLISTCS